MSRDFEKIAHDSLSDPNLIGSLVRQYVERMTTTTGRVREALGCTESNFLLLCLHPIPEKNRRRQLAYSLGETLGCNVEILADLLWQDELPPEQTVGRRIKILRKKKGWLVADLARAMADIITPNDSAARRAKAKSLSSTIQRLENDTLTNPTIETFAALAEALEVDLDLLNYGPIEDPGDKTSPKRQS